MPRPKSSAPAPADRPISRRVAVLVKHATDNMTAVPCVVWAHEIPILEAIHGDGKIEEIPIEKLNQHFKARASADLLVHNKSQDPFIPPSDALGVGFAFTGSHEAEFNRLAAVYGKHPEVNQPMVEHIYGRFASGHFTSVVGEADLGDMPDAQLRQLIRGHGFVPVTDRESSDAEIAEAREKLKKLSEATHEQLVELASQLVDAYA